MKHKAFLSCMLLISVAMPAFALQGSDCSSRSAKLKPAERDAFMKSCLAQAESPANVQEEERKHKNALCEQNAKNKKLQGGDKTAYQSNCMNKNEAAVAASEQPKNVISTDHKPAAGNTQKSTAQRKDAPKKKSPRKQKGRKDAAAN